MVYITGDTHNEAGRFTLVEQMLKKPLSETDLVLVCGDFGYLNSKEGESELERLAQKPYTICFVDGNHENFAALDALPVSEWNGGKVHRVRENIVHLMRGEIFTVEGKRIFTMGGAYSGEAFARADNRELPSNAEYNRAIENLTKVQHQVDYVVTHTAPREILLRMGKHPYLQEAELNGFFDWMMYELKFERWYFGHLHQDESIEPKFRALHFDVCKMGE